MSTTMKGLTTAIVLVLVMWTGVPAALAQTQAAAPVQDSAPGDLEAALTGDIELTRAVIQVRRQALGTAAMDLESEEADAFWAVYPEKRMAIGTVNGPFGEPLRRHLDGY